MTDIPWSITSLAQLAILLEVSSPKPGNVNRLRRFSDTGYRHFMASASLMGRGLHECALMGIKLGKLEIQSSEIRLGELIHECAIDVFGGLNKRNTILGTILFYVPLVVCAAAAISSDSKFTVDNTRFWLKKVINSTTVEDTINMYRSFHLANPAGEMKRESTIWTDVHDRFDIQNPRVYENIQEDQLTLIDLFELSADVEPIAKEWSDYFELTLTKVFPHLDSLVHDLENIEEGIVRTFVWLLSIQPDGLIMKKVGIKKAVEIQRLAATIIAEGKLDSESDEILSELDHILRSDGNQLNPGTTADFISAAILCKLFTITFP